MTKTMIAATRNERKLREMRAILGQAGFSILSRDEAGVPPEEIEETGATFEENALLKATEIMRRTGKPSLADDSGLCCDYLGGAPGIYSARFSGGDDEENNRKLVSLTKAVPEEKRTARYVCVMALVFPDGRTISARGEVEGHILLAPRGENGFGYDPYFVPVGSERTFAEYTPAEKDAVSHRGRALRKLVARLKEEGSEEPGEKEPGGSGVRADDDSQTEEEPREKRA